MQVTLGGDRIGSGNKNKVKMRNFERSSHDMSTIIRTSMATGVITPVFCDIATIGTTYEFNDIREIIRTDPTVGPAYASAEFRVEVFVYPLRLTQGILHNNPIKLGLNAQKVLLPQVEIPLASAADYKNYQQNGGNLPKKFASIGPSCLLNYLGAQTAPINTLGNKPTMELSAGPMMGYYDYVKDYHLNKQEDNAYVITINPVRYLLESASIGTYYSSSAQIEPQIFITSAQSINNIQNVPIYWRPTQRIFWNVYNPISIDQVYIRLKSWKNNSNTVVYRLTDLILSGTLVTEQDRDDIGTFTKASGQGYNASGIEAEYINDLSKELQIDWIGFSQSVLTNAHTKYQLQLTPFPIENLDKARYTILSNNQLGDKVLIKGRGTQNADNVINWLPYSVNAETNAGTGLPRNADTMNGLMVGCYKSDLFNNWLNTEWIEGENGVNELSAIPITDGNIYIDDMIVQKKVYMMLNRVILSDGTLRGYEMAVWGEDAIKSVESPIYCGGMSSEIVFDEVVSTSETQTEDGTSPIGTLAGRGRTIGKRGGKIKIRVEEASWIMAVATITPRIDYAEACKFYMTELKSFYDLHKPSLDQIGFQNLPVSQFAGWNGVPNASAGKQPSWIQYQTNYNTVHGDFAIDSKKGYMTFKRDYSMGQDSYGRDQVNDVTTYIDPTKYNRIFATKSLEEQHYQVQIAFDVIARRKMSANQIPNL